MTSASDNLAVASELYRQGNEHRKAGRYHDAINAYTEALELDPQSPALTARQMLEEQYEYYHKDYYNP